MFLIFFFFNDTAPTEIYTLSLHDALPISGADCPAAPPAADRATRAPGSHRTGCRSEEHTSELQSHLNLVCRLLLEKKKKTESIATRGRLHLTNTLIRRLRLWIQLVVLERY